MTTRFRIWFLLVSLCITTMCGGGATTVWGASVPVLVKDINTRIKNNANVKNLAAAGSMLFFTADNLAFGNELWKSDGTAAGTAMVKDIWPGSGSSYHDPNFITYWNGNVYFEAEDKTYNGSSWVSGWALWKSDGTAAGTVAVSTHTDPHQVDPEQITVFKGALYFSSYTKGLWKSDGTTAGTVEVKGGIGTLDNLVIVGGNKLYFTNNNNLWVSDGTTAGTVLLQSDIWPTQLTSVNGTLYFHGWDIVNDYRLWKSDGTASGTAMIPYDAEPNNLTDVNGTLYFTANDPTDGPSLVKLESGVPTVVMSGISPTELFNFNGVLFFRYSGDLWSSNGTLAGTAPVKAEIYPSQFTNVNGTLYFEGWDAVHDYELWKSDGTPAGTVMVKDIAPGTDSSRPTQITNVNGTAFFTATDPATGIQLWKSDGSAAGTVQVKNISPGSQDANPQSLLDVNGTLYFAADDYNTGNKLWQSNGTTMATSMVPGLTGSNPVPLANVNGTLFFAANSDDLWRRVGTNPAELVKLGVTTNNPSFVCNLNGILYFRGYDSTNGYELWKSDGTPTGTVMVKNIKSGYNGSDVRNLVKLGNTLYFIANADTVNNGQLWKSDGTDAGTVRVSASLKNVEYLTLVNGKLFFQGDDDASHTNALWVSDGATVTILKNDLSPTKLTAVGATLFFEGWTSPYGYELWKSDGTVAGTVLVKDITPGGSSSHPMNLTNVNGTLFFSVEVGSNGTTGHDQLWKSDGTTAGTVMVKDLPATYTYSDTIAELTSVHGLLAFTYMDKPYQPSTDKSAELWISDGTAAGTVKVAEIYPGDYGSNPMNLTMANTPPNGIDKEALFFSAIDPIYGNELFILDFTPPVSAISSPAPGAFLRGTTLSITGTASDSMPGTGVNFVDVSVDNGARTTDTSGNGTWATWQYTWTPLPVDGVYTIKSRATDVATNPQNPLASISVTIDNTPPTSAITQPLYYRGAPGLITGTASDNLSGVAKVEVSTDNGASWHDAVVTSVNSTSTAWQYSWTPLPADGSYPIKSRATDRSGNIQNPVASGTAIIDNVAPTSNITVPANGAYFHVTSTTISGTASDDRSGVAKVEVSTNSGASWQLASGTGSWQATVNLPIVNGPFTIWSRSTDRAGNVQSQVGSRTINIDNTQRTLFIDLAGTGGGSVKFVEKNQVCNTDCSATVYAGDPITLQASVDQYSLFGPWSGACTGSGGCGFTMSAVASITATATFTLDTPHAVLVSPNYYSTILGAYQAAATTSGSILRIWGITFPETLLFDQGKLVILRGGDNGAHSSNSGGMTTIQGPVTIKSGRITVENITIR